MQYVPSGRDREFISHLNVEKIYCTSVSEYIAKTLGHMKIERIKNDKRIKTAVIE